MKTLNQIRTEQAFGMMGKTFNVRHLKAGWPELENLGECRVVAVIIHESDLPEIGLSESSDPESCDYYQLEELGFEPLSHAG